MKRHLQLCGLVMLLAAPNANAHAFLERGSPGAGAEVAASPPELSLTFSESVEPLFSAIELRDENNIPVPAGAPHTSPDNARRLVIELPKLPPGVYSVFWRATSVDTHKTQGSYKFTIGP